MSTLELDRLEEDVAKARERVVADVARLRSPAAMAEFKADIGHTFSDSAQRTLDGLKSRAAANPAAVLAIGAGLMWRFARRPPIASILVGVGLASLMRTNPGSPPSPVVTRTGELAHAAAEKASEFTEQAREYSAQAREAASAAAETVSHTAARVADQATQLASRVSDQAVDTATRLSGEASEAAARMSGQAAEAAARMSEGAGQFAAQASRSADRMTAAAQRALADSSTRDAFLLGFAAIAVGAAAFINYRRGEA
jgi:chemotaxis protein histidine kinase CheA